MSGTQGGGNTVTFSGFITVPAGTWTYRDLPNSPMRLECKMELFIRALRGGK